MAEVANTMDERSRSPLADITGTDTVAETGGVCGVELREMPQAAAVLVAARRGETDAASAALAQVLGATPPATPAIAAAGDARILWSGPGKWLVMLDGAAAAAHSENIRAATKESAAIVDQSDMRVELALSGPHARDVLSRLVSIDVDAAAFPPGSAAMTGIAHVSGHVWLAPARTGQPEVFHILGPRSYAESLWHHVVVAAEQYGLRAITVADGARSHDTDAAD